jgi:transcriptional regulator with XRE-family HTH domain
MEKVGQVLSNFLDKIASCVQLLSNFMDKIVSLQANFKNILLMNIGDNLRVLRTKNNISSQEIADYLGVDRKTYVGWETGQTDIKSSYLPKLAEFLHVEINDLFQKKPGEIVINQNNSDNKDGSINAGVILLLTDKEAIDQFVDVLQKRFGGNDSGNGVENHSPSNN